MGGQGDNDCLFWARSNQINDAASVELLDSPHGGARLRLNGFSEKFNRLEIAPHTKVLTDGPNGAGGVLGVSRLTVAGKEMPRGVHTSAESWIEGNGFVTVGDVKYVEISGAVDQPADRVGAGNIAVITNTATLILAGDFDIPVQTMNVQLTLEAACPQAVRCTGLMTCRGSLVIAAGKGGLELGGKAPNCYTGTTRLNQGVLKLNKPGMRAVPSDLLLGGDKPENNGDGVAWQADHQMNDQAIITMGGTQPCFLDLNGHADSVMKVVMSPAARIKSGAGGKLNVRQIVRDGKPVAPGIHTAASGWIEGNGTVIVNPLVDVGPGQASIASLLGSGNIANLTGDAGFGYPGSLCDVDIINNGFTMTFDSGDGNPLCYSGSISGTGNVVFRMGPSHTGYKHAPLRIAGLKPNTAAGKFIANKGRVQLEKPDGVDAISGDAIVGGQGFNDCLYWKRPNQIKDSVNITLLDAGNSGAAYLNLNGCSETVQSLTLTAKNKIQTDGDDGKGGVLRVKSLTVSGVKRSAGAYTAATESWIEGAGKVIVQQ